MTAVVILSWDRAALRLEYVEVNDGQGGVAVVRDVSADDAGLIERELAGRELPWHAELEAEGMETLLDAAGGVHVTACSVRTVGPPGAREFELKAKASRSAVRVLAARLGVADPAGAAAMQRFEYLYAENLEPPGCWLGCEGGAQAWLAEWRQQAEARRREAEADRRFINPYTFVSFPARVARCAPAGHHLLGDGRLSGTFTVTWEFTTPFQAPPGASGTIALRVPGSSVKGAVRSVHEALTGGCLRVFDEDFVPSYRDTPTPRSADWTLAQVSEATRDGQPLAVRLCDEVVWADARQLRRATNGTLRSGSRVTISDDDIPPKPDSLGRKVLAGDAEIQAGGDWIVLVTAAGTRSVKKGTYFLACGRLVARTAEVTESAWSAFRFAVADADDLRRTRRASLSSDPDDRQPTAEVSFGSQPIGQRRVVTGWLWPGDVIWVRVTAGGAGTFAAQELSLAAIWRHPGWPGDTDEAGIRERWAAGSRVPEDLRACRDPAWLCATCRVFGSADPDSRDRDSRADQRAYAGHVRFGDACSGQPVELTSIQRAPMGAPRPGAGQFYLALEGTSPAAGRDSRPTREWGSDQEKARPRRLRGRKFYWHADPRAQDPPRHIARKHQQDKQLSTPRWIAVAGTRLSQRISFDNLSPAELGGLLAAFEPQRVLAAPDGGRLLSRLGGGKPLGLGSCIATVSALRVWDADSRYGGGSGPVADEDGFVGEFVGTCPDQITRTWSSLSAVLADGSVDARRVWYPPGAYWPDQSRDEQEFDEPFAFFKGSSGMFLQDKPARALVPLPAAAAEDQGLPIIRKADLE